MRIPAISKYLLYVFLCLLTLFSCDLLSEHPQEEHDDSYDVVDTSSTRIAAHYPEFGDVITQSIDSVKLFTTDVGLINSESLYSEIFQYPETDSAWFVQSGIMFASASEPGEKACFSSEYAILYTQKATVSDGVVFNISGGCPGQEARIRSGYRYLVHVYDDENQVKFYWTFRRE